MVLEIRISDCPVEVHWALGGGRGRTDEMRVTARDFKFVTIKLE